MGGPFYGGERREGWKESVRWRVLNELPRDEKREEILSLRGGGEVGRGLVLRRHWRRSE